MTKRILNFSNDDCFDCVHSDDYDNISYDYDHAGPDYDHAGPDHGLQSLLQGRRHLQLRTLFESILRLHL